MKHRLPIPSLDDAAKALEATLPAEMRQEIEATRAQEYAEAHDLAEKLHPQLQAWQRRIITKLVGADVLLKADKRDPEALARIAAQRIIQEHKVKTKGNKTTLTFIFKRHMPESNRIIEVGRFRYHFEVKNPPPAS